MEFNDYIYQLLAFMSVFLFAFLYYYTTRENPHKHWNGISKDKELDFQEMLYFSFTCMSSAGFGDITPKSKMARRLVMVQEATLLLEIIMFFTKLAKKYKE
jgi:uncharacterized membrane protein